ncbi:MAG: hypothetical protein V3U92_05720 [Cellulophaga sp.]
MTNLSQEPWPLKMARNYPALYHYTHTESLKELLKSKSLLARPIGDFSDTDEYIHGLKLIQGELTKTWKNENNRTRVEHLLRSLYGTIQPDVQQVLGQVLENITYEINNIKSPKVKIFVSCLTVDPESEKMRKEYGDCVISFNFMLPILAYYPPPPITSSMLSRVSYDDQEFVAGVLDQGFYYEHSENVRRQLSILSPLSSNARSEAIANWVTERLCLFAPNIKKPKFKKEKEWRLKSAISLYSSNRDLARSPHCPSFFDLPETARFDENGRYLQRLTFCEDKFISRGISCAARNTGDLAAWVQQWQSQESLPRVDINAISSRIAMSL